MQINLFPRYLLNLPHQSKTLDQLQKGLFSNISSIVMSLMTERQMISQIIMFIFTMLLYIRVLWCVKFKNIQGISRKKK